MSNPDFEKSPPLILLVNDKKTMRREMHLAMEKEGYRVAQSDDGEECLAACQRLKPDMVLLLLDGMNSKMDGFSCCEELQTLLGDDCPPVLIVTVLDDRESVDRAFEVGAADYVTKPVHWPVLRQRVKRLLQSHWTMRKLKRQIEQERLLRKRLETTNRELQNLATLDGLTQIANRRSFDHYLEREWKILAREEATLSLIFSDVDFFKLYNDTYGHQAGDECLRQIARIISQNAKRPADFVARYGGEEFAVILPKTDAEGAVEVAETIRTQVKALGLTHTGSQISEFVTLSLGVSSVIPNSQSSANTLIAETDQALYQAKAQGRDRVVLKLSSSDTIQS